MVSKRGIVLNFDELHDDLLTLVEQSSLNVLGLHNWSPDGRFETKIDEMIHFRNTSEGCELIDRFGEKGIDIEYEIHAISWLLPRQLFPSHPQLFRMNEAGERTPDANCCPTNQECMEIIQQNSIVLAQKLKPTSNRYFFWQDDTKPWCNCMECRDLSSSDQNLLLMNTILEALRSVHPQAELAFLAYMNTLEVVPSLIVPSEGIFLEVTGPIIHNAGKLLRSPHQDKEFQQSVAAQLELFSVKSAHVLEYWLDVSFHSNWKRPASKLFFDEQEISNDIRYYQSVGFDSMTSFGVFMDKDYFDQHGEPPIRQYGKLLA